MMAIGYLKAKPMAQSVAAGLIASLYCGGSLFFASIGLGASYSTLGLARYTPQALAAGALSILAINYLLDASTKVSGPMADQHRPAH
jgi:hypothetical protein